MTAPGGAGGFRVARGFVEVDAIVDKASGDRAAAEAGKSAGESFEREFTRHWEKQARDSRGRFIKQAEDDGGHSGVRFAAKFTDTLVRVMAATGGKATSILGDSFKNIPPQVQAGIGGGIGMAIATGAPVLAAAISGAVVGGVGIGGMLGGVILAAQDPRVKEAGKSFGRELFSNLKSDSMTFVPAVLDALAFLRADAAKTSDQFERIFRNSSRFVAPLTSSLSKFTHSILNGLEAVTGQGLPAVQAMGIVIERTGALIDYTLTSMAENSREGGEGLIFLFSVVEFGVGSMVGLIDVLTKTYGAMSAVNEAAGLLGPALFGVFGVGMSDAKNSLDTASEAGAGLTERLEAMGLATSGYSSKIATATQETKAFWEVLDEAREQNLSMAEAQVRAAEVTASATKEIRENGEATSLTTEKGRANQRALLDMARAYNTNQRAAEENSVSAEEANRIYQKQRTAFINAAIAAGYSEKAAASLADQYLQTPKEVNTTFNAETTAAQKKAERFKTTLSGIPRHIFIKAEFDLINDAEVAMALRLGRIADGGLIHGKGPKGVDSVPMLTAPGEFVVRSQVVDALGVPFFEAINNMGRGGAGLGAVVPTLAAKATSAPAAATTAAPAAHGPYQIEIDGRVLVAFMIDAISGNPTVVAQAAAEGNRLRSWTNTRAGV